MSDFLKKLSRDPFAPIDGASIVSVDELGNGYDYRGTLIAPKFEAPQQSWGEMALGVLTAPQRLGGAIYDSLTPYQFPRLTSTPMNRAGAGQPITGGSGDGGWQMPPIVGEGVNAVTAVGDAYNYGMTDDEINSRALGMAGFMMGGGGLAARPATSTGVSLGDRAIAAYKNARHPYDVEPTESMMRLPVLETKLRAMDNTKGAYQSIVDKPYANDWFDEPMTPGEAGYMNATLHSRKPEFDVIDGGLLGRLSSAYAPDDQLNMFGGRKAKTANLERLAIAERLAAEGADRNAIWNETGWFQGPDQKWRFEIDDSGMAHRIKPTEWIPERVPGKPWMAPNVETAANKAMDGLSPSAPLRVKRLFDHNELETAYPNGFHYNSPDYQHQGITGMRVNLIEGEGPDAAFMGDRIALHEKLTPGIAKEATLHELQHAIQQHEGFARGGNRSLFTPEEIASERARIGAVPEDKTGWTSVGSAAGDAPDTDVALGLYKRLAGETEARNVQKRMNMRADERRATPPWETQDIPDIDQIVRLYSNASKEGAVPALLAGMAGQEEGYASGGRVRSWTGSNEVWNSLTPFQKAAAMALMEADAANIDDARNALGAMVNRAKRDGSDIGEHVSKPIYQPTIEPAQERRLGRILSMPQFSDLTGWAERRWSGQEPDPVQGATHFLAPERTMVALTAREPNKYRSWPKWTGYNPETGSYKNVVLRDGSHAFVAPEGVYSAPGRDQGSINGGYGVPPTGYAGVAGDVVTADAGHDVKPEFEATPVRPLPTPTASYAVASSEDPASTADAKPDFDFMKLASLFAEPEQTQAPQVQFTPVQAFQSQSAPIAATTPYRNTFAYGGQVRGLPDGSEPIHAGPLHSTVPGRTDHLPITVAAGSFVLPADIVSSLGEGNTNAGMEAVSKMFPLPPVRRADGGRVPIAAAGGEYVIAPETVAALSGGNLEAGHEMLDEFVRRTRAQNIQRLRALPGPEK